MRDFHSLYFCVSTLLMSLSVSAQQNCTLGVGGKNTETISKVFQLNEEQQATMQELISEEYDKKLLSTFNERQYRRYVDLCSEVFRKPFLVTPTKYTDSIPSPK